MEDVTKDEFERLLELLSTLYKFVLENLGEVDVMDRYNMLCEKYPSLSKAHPMVVKYLSTLMYNEKAFRRYFRLSNDTRGTGMKGFVECQAAYAKYLYIEECRRCRRPVNKAQSEQVYAAEVKEMRANMKRIEDAEKRAKSQYDEEQERNLEHRRTEFLDFVNSQPLAERRTSKFTEEEFLMELKKCDLADLPMSSINRERMTAEQIAMVDGRMKELAAEEGLEVEVRDSEC